MSKRLKAAATAAAGLSTETSAIGRAATENKVVEALGDQVSLRGNNANVRAAILGADNPVRLTALVSLYLLNRYGEMYAAPFLIAMARGDV